MKAALLACFITSSFKTSEAFWLKFSEKKNKKENQQTNNKTPQKIFTIDNILLLGFPIFTLHQSATCVNAMHK